MVFGDLPSSLPFLCFSSNTSVSITLHKQNSSSLPPPPPPSSYLLRLSATPSEALVQKIVLRLLRLCPNAQETEKIASLSRLSLFLETLFEIVVKKEHIICQRELWSICCAW